MEKIPKNNQKSPLKWYIDSAHYRPEVGNLIIDLVVNNSVEETTIPEDFGVIINKDNIEQHLKKIRSDQQSYHQNYSQVIEEMETHLKLDKK